MQSGGSQPEPAPEAPSIEALLDQDHPIKAAATAWATEHLHDRGHGVVGQALWHAAGAQGIHGLFLPRELGGSDATATEAALVFEGLGASGRDLGEVFALAGQCIAANRALGSWSSDEVRQRWLGDIATGAATACFAMSEADAGSSPWEMETRARARDDGSWILRGQKAWVTLGPIADVAVVFALTDPDRGHWGVTAFVVDLALDGVGRTTIPKIGLVSCPFGELTFDDVVLPDSAVLGRVGAGGSIFTKIVEFERALLYSIPIGATEHLLDRTVHRARTRQQGGVHIGAHQAVSHRLVDMTLAHEAARALLYKTTLLHDHRKPATMASALTKLAASEMAVQSAIDAMRTFGTEGYLERTGLDIELLDALGGFAYSGTPDVTRNVIASLLGLDRPAAAQE